MNRILCLVLVAGVAFSLGHFLRVPIPQVGAAGGAGGRGAQEGEYFACADSNGDGIVNVADPVYTLRYLFSEASEPRCEALQGRALPATGQTKCYDDTGDEIPCDSTDFSGQDGYFQAGCPAEGRFVDNGDGTVADTCTGLMWQKEPAPGDYKWYHALKACEDLNLAGHSDWRLPNVRELQTIVDYGRFDPDVDPIFGMLTGSYWSSTSYVYSPDYAYLVSLNFGYITGQSKDYYYFVRAVRNTP